MDKQQILLEQYRTYNELKEKYVERAFSINRFFMVFVGILFLLMLILKTVFSEAYMLLAGLEFFGLMLCVMWFSNQDAYSSIIKIKYCAVLEKMEEELPCAPITDEYKELCSLRKDKKIIHVKDTQKWFAIIVTLIFIAAFLLDFTSLILSTFFNV